MARGGQKKLKADPERRCIVTGEVQGKHGLIKFVVGPDGQLVADVFGKLPGRGLWVSADRATIEKAAAKGMFARAARTAVTVPDGFVDEVERQQLRRVTDLIALTRKSGQAVAGFEKVKSWLSEGRAKVLLQAYDGSERGKGKFWTPEGGRWFGCLSANELGLAFGRESVIHGALASGGLARRVVEEATRLNGLRQRYCTDRVGKDKTT